MYQWHRKFLLVRGVIDYYWRAQTWWRICLNNCWSPGALYASSWTLHMSLCHGRAWIEIFFYPVRRQIEAPFEAPAPNSFEKGGNFGATEGLVCKPNAICFCLSGVCKNAIWVTMLARASANTGAAGEIMSATWWEVVPIGEPNKRVHKSVAGSFAPFKIGKTVRKPSFN